VFAAVVSAIIQAQTNALVFVYVNIVSSATLTHYTHSHSHMLFILNDFYPFSWLFFYFFPGHHQHNGSHQLKTEIQEKAAN